MRKTIKLLNLLIGAVILNLSIVSNVSAHVVVRPGEVGASKYVTFSVSVPSERSNPTVAVKLDIPEGVESVVPHVKTGWDISIEGDEQLENSHSGLSTVKSITWSGGVIPKGMKDEFLFSARTPVSEGDIIWRAYQTYQDGTLVAWDKSEQDQPKGEDGSPEYSSFGPFSVTRVIDSSASSTEAVPKIENRDTASSDKTLYISVSAIVVSFIALIFATSPSNARLFKKQK